jgi:hypothetical protein
VQPLNLLAKSFVGSEQFTGSGTYTFDFLPQVSFHLFGNLLMQRDL